MREGKRSGRKKGKDIGMGSERERLWVRGGDGKRERRA